MRQIRKNREFNIVSLSFIDLLTGALGALALILFSYIYIYKNISKDAFNEIKLVTENVPDAHIDQALHFAFSAIGGLEPYSWQIDNAKTPPCGLAVMNGLPAGLKLDCDTGVLQGKLGDGVMSKLYGHDKNYPLTFCFHVKAIANGKNEKRLVKFDEIRKTLEKENLTEKERIAAFAARTQKYLTVSKHYHLKVWPPLHIKPPVAKAVKLPDAVANKRYEYEFEYLFGKYPVSWELDKGLTFIDNGNNPVKLSKPPFLNENRLVWTPEKPGKLAFSLLIGDKYHAADNHNIRNNFEIIVKRAGFKYRPPVIKTSKTAPGFRHKQYLFQLAVENGQPPFEWNVEGLPKGLRVEKKTGIISGTPDIRLKQKQTYKVFNTNIAVIDAKNNLSSGTLPFTIHNRTEVIDQLSIATTQADLDRHEFYLNKEIEPFRFICKGGDSSKKRWNFTFNPVGAGLWREGDRLAGKPKNMQNILFTARVEDKKDWHEKSFTINAKLGKLEIVSETLPEGEVNRFYDVTIKAVGGKPPYKWIISTSPHAQWLYSKMIKKGFIMGTPDKKEEYTLDITVSDSGAPVVKANKKLDLIIREKSGSYNIVKKNAFFGLDEGCEDLSATCALPPGFTYAAYSHIFSQTELNALTLTTGKLPEGMGLTREHNKCWSLHGRPIKTGVYEFNLEFSLNSNHKEKKRQTFKMEIRSSSKYFHSWLLGLLITEWYYTCLLIFVIISLVWLAVRYSAKNV